MLKLFILIIAIIITIILTAFVYPFSRILCKINKRKGDLFSLHFVQGAMKFVIFLSGAKIEYVGLENIPEEGTGVCYISNHRGFMDVVSTYPVVKGPTGFIAKKEMRTWPLIGWWMHAVYCLFLDRKDRRQGMMTILEGAKNIENGVSMWIFPEGTRSKVEGEMLPFKHGSFKLATKAKAPLVPVAINGSASIFDDHVPWITKGNVRVEFCKPIETKDMTLDEMSELPDRVHKIIEDIVKEHADINDPK